MPSRLNLIYWANSFDDIKYKLKLAHTRKEAELHQHYEIMLKVVGQIFGGSDSGSSPKSDVKPTANIHEAEAQIAAIFG